MSAYTLTFTRAGLDAVVAAQGNGLAAKITHIALGAGKYTPTGDETRLKDERERIPITLAIKDGSNFRLTASTEPGISAEYWIHEAGAFLEDGTLLAVWASPDKNITGRGKGAEIDFDFTFSLSTLPKNSINIQVVPGGSAMTALLSAITACNAALTEQQIAQRIEIENLKIQIKNLKQE